ncbi:hypothetical protein Tco_1552780, partial [Tanacetum coccineum]
DLVLAVVILSSTNCFLLAVLTVGLAVLTLKCLIPNTKVVAGSSKRSAEEELGEESSKRQKIGEGSEPAEESKDKESDELSQEQLQ